MQNADMWLWVLSGWSPSGAICLSVDADLDQRVLGPWHPHTPLLFGCAQVLISKWGDKIIQDCLTYRRKSELCRVPLGPDLIRAAYYATEDGYLGSYPRLTEREGVCVCVCGGFIHDNA